MNPAQAKAKFSPLFVLWKAPDPYKHQPVWKQSRGLQQRKAKKKSNLHKKYKYAK